MPAKWGWMGNNEREMRSIEARGVNKAERQRAVFAGGAVMAYTWRKSACGTRKITRQYGGVCVTFTSVEICASVGALLRSPKRN